MLDYVFDNQLKKNWFNGPQFLIRQRKKLTAGQEILGTVKMTFPTIGLFSLIKNAWSF